MARPPHRPQTCKFEYPVGFISSSGAREVRLRLGAHVKLSAERKDDAGCPIVHISKAVTLIIDRSACVTYVFGSWFKDAGVDEQTECRLVRPDNTPKLPFALGSIIEQVMVVHQCKRKCSQRSQRASDSHNPARCHHRCRILPCCPEHRSPDCKEAACLKQIYAKEWLHYERGADYAVFDRETGFSPRSAPQPLVDSASDSVM